MESPDERLETVELKAFDLRVMVCTRGFLSRVWGQSYSLQL